MTTISVNFDKVKGRIKPMHAVGQPPFKGGFAKLDFSPSQILKDANIPYARLHDVGGAFGGNRYVDIPNVFRDFDADENDPASYDFTFTDALLKGMAEYGIEPYYRLGVTIENQCHIKAYRIYPPKDYAKWARICEHIIRHYNEGWADGFHYGIKYWEIWNEADNREVLEKNQMWRGTPQQYYELYDVTAKHLKKCFGDTIKVGGYAACGFYGIYADPRKYGLNIEKRYEKRFCSAKEEYRINFFLNFLDYIKAHGSPIDFFSWHSYAGVEVTPDMADFVDKELTARGFGDIETHLNEWNNSHEISKNKMSSYASSRVAAMMCAMQDKKTTMLMYYDARYPAISAYAGFYDVTTLEPCCVYYAFKAFGELYALKNQVQCKVEGKNVFSVAATDGKHNAMMIANVSDEDQEIEINLGQGYKVYLIDVDNFLTETDRSAAGFTLKKDEVVFIKNYE